jgi:hypothetical protein
LRISEVHEAVRGALDDVGLDGDRPLAFLAFDTCLLGAAEVSHALADLSEIYVANAEIDYGDGWDYEAMLTYIAANRDVDALELGAHEAGVWDAHHRAAGASDRLLRSHVVLDTAEVAAVDEAIGGLADALLAADRWLDLAIVTSRSMPPYGGGVDRAYREVQYRDLGLVARRLSRNEDATIADAAERVLRALASARTGGSQGSMRESTGQLGLSVALPLPLDITTELLASYRERAAGFTERTRWDDVLQELGAAADDVRPTPSLTATDAGDGVDVSVRVDDEDVVRIEVHVAADDPDRADNDIRYGVIGAAAAEPGVTYAFRWDRAIATLDGTNPVPLEQWVDGGATADEDPLPSLVSVGGHLVAAGEDPVPCQLVIEESTRTADVLVITENEDNPVALTLAQAREDYPDHTFVPALVSEGSAGRVELDGTAITLPESGSLSLTRRPLSAGRYVITVYAMDAWGNEGVATQDVMVP